MTTHNGNLNRSKIDAKPEAGTRQCPGKTNQPTETFRDGKQPKPEKVRELSLVALNKGAAIAAAQRQAEGDGSDKGVINGNPKKRTSNSFGVKEK